MGKFSGSGRRCFNPTFEAAVRRRVEQLLGFHHDSFPLVRPIKRLGHDDGLAVVSTYSSGASLTEALKKPRSVGIRPAPDPSARAGSGGPSTACQRLPTGR